MSQIIINPVTRISGMMEIEVTVENNLILDAKTDGLMFRGFELMLKGRPPLDAVYFTQRICGICSAAHATASSMGLESALGVTVSEQGRYLRDITHICDFLQNHIRHFYQLTVPDYVKLPDMPLFEATGRDFRMPPPVNDRIARHYFDSLAISRLGHTMMAVLGGKAPHCHGIYVGGVTKPASTQDLLALRSMARDVRAFVEEAMLPDAYAVAQYYGEYFHMGGGFGNMLSYGCFNNYPGLGTLYVDPLVWIGGAVHPLDPAGINENTATAFYREPPATYTPFETVVEADPGKPDAYSFIKAPRYLGFPCEVGPLARMWLTGEYRNGISAMDRTIARALETQKLLNIFDTLLERVIPDTNVQAEYTVPREAMDAGLVDTSRGALGHWIRIEDGVIALYQIITPSAWNLSSQTQDTMGTAEQALLGAHVADLENPVEIGRIIRSFDPCVSCATHVHTPGGQGRVWKVVP